MNNEKGVLAKGMLSFFPLNLKHLNFYEFFKIDLIFYSKNHVVDKKKVLALSNKNKIHK